MNLQMKIMRTKMKTWNMTMGILSLLFLNIYPTLAVNINPQHENPRNEWTENSLNQSRTRKLTGIILDTNGESIIGANVVVKGTTDGTITDPEGKFSIEIPNNCILQGI